MLLFFKVFPFSICLTAASSARLKNPQ